MSTDTCVFCEIIAHKSPATFVGEWKHVVAIVPLNPVVEGHTLFIPRAHFANPWDRPIATASAMVEAVTFAEQFWSANFILSAGRAATQSIDHVHIHVVPRTEDDQLMVPWGTIYGDDPQAPHWCRVAQGLQEQLDGMEQP